MVAIMVWSDPKINCVQSQNTKMCFNVSIVLFPIFNLERVLYKNKTLLKVDYFFSLTDSRMSKCD